MADHVDPASRIFGEFEASERALLARYLELVAYLRATLSVRELEAAIGRGGLGAVEAEFRRAARSLGAGWSASFTRAGSSTSAFIEGKVGLLVDFLPGNPSAVRQLEAASLRLIREFTEQQRAAVRTALVEGTRLGLNPRDQARAFRDAIGLTENQVRAVQNFRRLLMEGNPEALTRELRDRRFDPTVRAGISSRTGVSGERLERMVERYRQRYLAYRAETIARTEALASVHTGAQEAYNQAVAEGFLEPGSLSQEWYPTPDQRTRDSHRAMRSQVRPFGEAFISGLGNRLRYPGDVEAPPEDRIQCRCSLLTRFQAAQGIASRAA